MVAVRAACIPEVMYDGVNGFLAEARELVERLKKQ